MDVTSNCVEGLLTRQSKEYKIALEVELWKSIQLQQHEEVTRVKENKIIKTFSLEFKEKERSRAIGLEKSKKSCDDVVRQYKLKLENMERREKALLENVEKFKRSGEEQEKENNSKLEDIRQKTSHQQDLLSLQLEISDIRIKEVERSNSLLCKRRDTVDRKVMRKEEDDILNADTINSLSEETHLQLITAKLLDTKLKKQVSKLKSDKEKYKNKLRTVLEQLSNEQKKTKNEPYSSSTRDIIKCSVTPDVRKQSVDSVEDEFRSLKCEVDEMLKIVESVPEKSKVLCDDVETEIAQLISERNTLLNTGVYFDSDFIITQIDAKIKELMAIN